MKIFLDTNVWIDFLGERHPFYQAAASLLSLADEGRCRLVVSSLTMVNANFVCFERGHMPLELWRRKVNALADLVEICNVSTEAVRKANVSEWKDYEDCVQYHAAKEAGCDIIVTRNCNDFALSDIEVCLPEQVLAQL